MKAFWVGVPTGLIPPYGIFVCIFVGLVVVGVRVAIRIENPFSILIGSVIGSCAGSFLLICVIFFSQ